MIDPDSGSVVAHQTTGLAFTSSGSFNVNNNTPPEFAFQSFGTEDGIFVFTGDFTGGGGTIGNLAVASYDASAGSITAQGYSTLSFSFWDSPVVARGAAGVSQSDVYFGKKSTNGSATPGEEDKLYIYRLRFTGLGSWTEALLYTVTGLAEDDFCQAMHYDTENGNLSIPIYIAVDDSTRLVIIDGEDGTLVSDEASTLDHYGSQLFWADWQTAGTLVYYDQNQEKLFSFDTASGAETQIALAWVQETGAWWGHNPAATIAISNRAFGGPSPPAKILIAAGGPGPEPLTLAWSIIKRATATGALTEDQVVCEGLNEPIAGFLVWQNDDFRAHLDNDGPLFGFEYFESGDGIKCRKAVDGAAFTIDRTLTLGDFMLDRPEDSPVRVSRSGGNETPAIVNCNYIDPSVEYRISKQRARRVNFPVPTLNSNVTADFVTSIIMEADEALSAAGRALFRMDAGRLAVAFRLNARHIDIEPAAILQLPAVAGRVLVVKVTEATIREDLSVDISASVILANEAISLTGEPGEALTETNEPPVVSVRETEGGNARETEGGSIRMMEGSDIG